MSQQGPLPFLEFCGEEIANAARTVSYLRAGLGNTMQGHWELGEGDVCSVLYRLGSGCIASTFVSPAADPAPWYDANEAGSADFLGFIMLTIDGYDSTITRPYANLVSKFGGGAFGGQFHNARVWKFRAAMISSSDAGAEYGLRWLTQALKATTCDTCATCDLAVRLVCPPDNCSDDDLGKWISYDTALVDGPREVEQRAPGSPTDVLAGCRDLVIVEFTMVAGNPYLYKPPRAVGGPWTFTPGTLECAAVTRPTLGVLGAVVSMTTAAGVGGPLILQSFSPVCGVGDPDHEIVLSGLPAASTVVVDSARHLITVEVGGVTSDGSYLVELAPNRSIDWLEIADCDTGTCFCVDLDAAGSGSFSGTIETQIREG